MRSLFTAVINQPLNTLVDSATITVSGIGTGVPLTLISGFVYKNGASVNSTTISDGDKLRMRVRSSTAYATPAFAVIQIGSEETIFSVSTIADPATIPVTSFENLTPLELTKYADGTNYVPDSTNNVLSVYSGTSLSKKVPLIAPTTNVNDTSDTAERITLAAYHSNNVFVLNSTQAVIASITVGNNPYGVASTVTSSTNDTALTWVTIAGESKVVLLDRTHAIVGSYATGSRPLGIASTVDGTHVFVANNISNTVTHFALSGNVWNSTTIAVGSKPFEVVVDNNDVAWISCTGEDKIYRITKTDVVTSYATGAAPRGLMIAGDGTLWVANSKANTITQHNVTTGAIVRTIATSAHPYAMSLASDGAINVSTFIDSKVESYSQTTWTLLRTVFTDAYPYGISTYGSFLIVANLYSNTPTYVTPKDQIATQFSFADPLSIPKGVAYTTNTITVAGLNIATAVGVPDVFNARIIKNGVNTASTTTTVVNGDTLAIVFTPPNVYDMPIDIPMFIGNVYESITTRTAFEDVTPNALTFTSVASAVPNASYTSNTVTIAGMDSTTIVPLTVDGAIIILNGVEQAVGVTTVNIKVGDTIALKLTSSATSAASKYATIWAGKIVARSDGTTTSQVQSTWRVTTKLESNDKWIKPELKGNIEYLPLLSPTGIAGKSYTRIDLSTNAITNYALSIEPTTFISERQLAPSYFDGTVYQFDGSVLKSLDTSNTSKPVDSVANRYAAFTGSLNYVKDYATNTTVALSGIPRKMAYHASTKTLYVTLASGNIAVIVENAETNVPEAQSLIVTGGSPYAIAINDAGDLWVSDVANSRAYHIVNNAIAHSVAIGIDAWDMAISSTHLWTANSYDNTLTKISLADRTTQTIKIGSVPNLIDIDANGNVWVADYGSSTLIKIDPNTNAKLFETTLAYSSANFLSFDAQYIYISQFTPNAVSLQNKVSALTPLTLNFGPMIVDEYRNTKIQSPKVTVTNLIRPTLASIEPNAGYDLYLNDVKVEGASTTLSNGDTVYLDVLTSSEYYTIKNATVNDFQSTNIFSVRTETNLKPELVSFADIYDAVPWTNVASTPVVIKGMTPGHTTTLRLSKTLWTLSVNGGAAVTTATVKNDDSVVLSGPVRGSYGTSNTYDLLSGKSNYLVGTLRVYNKALDGANANDASGINSYKPLWDTRTHIHTDLLFASSSFEKHVAPSAIITNSSIQFVKLERPSFNEAETISFTRLHRPSFNEAETISFTRLHRPSFNEAETISFVRLDRPSFHEVDSIPFELTREPTFLSALPVFEQMGQGNSGVEFDALPMELNGRSIITVESEINEILPIINESNGGYSFVTPSYLKSELQLSSHEFAPTFEIAQRQANYYFTFGVEKNSRTASLEYGTSFEKNSIEIVASPLTIYQRSVGKGEATKLVDLPTAISMIHRKSIEVQPAIFESMTHRSLQTSPERTFDRDAKSEVKSFDKARASNLHDNVLYRKALAEVSMPAAILSTKNVLREVQFSGWERNSPSTSEMKIPTAILSQQSTVYYSDDKSVSYVNHRGAYALPPVLTAVRNVRYLGTYTYAESAEDEGAFSNAADAVAAGVEAGYPLAYAVLIEKGKYMWATPLPNLHADCGIPLDGPRTFAMPEKWYVQGG